MALSGSLEVVCSLEIELESSGGGEVQEYSFMLIPQKIVGNYIMASIEPLKDTGKSIGL